MFVWFKKDSLLLLLSLFKLFIRAIHGEILIVYNSEQEFYVIYEYNYNSLRKYYIFQNAITYFSVTCLMEITNC